MHKILDRWLHKPEKNISIHTDTQNENSYRQIFDNIPFHKEELVKLYRGKFLHKLYSVRMNLPNIRRQNKVIVFDLDETIGSFGDFVLLLHYLEGFLGQRVKPIEQTLFNELLDLYPQFLRYGILNVFQFLSEKKKKHECYKIYIYTNNKYSPEFPQKIQNYLDYKLGITDFIDKIISAFKIGNKIIEPSRTTNEKTHRDFIQCTMLPKNTEICFVDNTIYTDMQHNKIFYIQPKNYYHKMEWRAIVNIFVQSPLYLKYFSGLSRDSIFALKQMRSIENDGIVGVNDIAVYQKLMYYVKEFFLLTTRREKTKKMKYNIGKFTRKNKKR